MRTVELPLRPPVEPATALAGARRLDSVDLLRGLVMVVMCLDHVRDFFGTGSLNPRDVTQAGPFLTRWVTHFCAPTFVFLAGLSAYLYGLRDGRTSCDVARFLLTRGLWLVAVEVSLVNFGWTFDPRFGQVTLQVIWAIGCSMVALAGLVFLPRPVVAAVAVALIFGHNLLDGVRADALGPLRPLWLVLHEPGMLVTSSAANVFLLYPLIPWVGVMAAGYALGPVMRLDSGSRRAWLYALGAALVLSFVALRITGGYGDPAGMVVHDAPSATVLSALNCEKYPPSLLYLLMTLGPAMIVLAACERATGRLAGALVAFGRVPFLYYVAHVYLIHGLAVAWAWAGGFDLGWLFRDLPMMNKPAGFGVGLPVVYAIWLVVVAILYPLCRWFAGVKRRRKDWWLSYL